MGETGGWNIEKRYATNTLIGNWYEERLKYSKKVQPRNSTYRLDYTLNDSVRPDCIQRRRYLLRNNGLEKDMLFTHHGKAYENNMKSCYDDDYSKGERDSHNKLPELRTWDSTTLTWAPEKSDFPNNAGVTKWGLANSKARQWKTEVANLTHGDYHTTYGNSFVRPSNVNLLASRYAPYKERSLVLNPANNKKDDLKLRNKNDSKMIPQHLEELANIAC